MHFFKKVQKRDAQIIPQPRGGDIHEVVFVGEIPISGRFLQKLPLGRLSVVC